MDKTIKCVIVGDGGAGKSSLLITYTTNSFPQDYVPTVFDNYNASLMLDNSQVTLSLWDTAGQEDYDRLRPLSYPGTDVFLCCFSITNPTSFQNIQSKWVPELLHYSPDTPIVIVATKVDLRNSEAARAHLLAQNHQIIEKEAGLTLAKQIGASLYVETSALTGTGIRECFTEAVRVALNPLKAKKKLINVLVPPALPPAERSPWIHVDGSSFITGDGFKQLINNEFASDVQFRVKRQSFDSELSNTSEKVWAHKVILSVASPMFCKLFQVKDECNNDNNNNIENDVNASNEELKVAVSENTSIIEFYCKNKHDNYYQVISQVYTEDQSVSSSSSSPATPTSKLLIIELVPEISSDLFQHVLEFLYTSSISKVTKQVAKELVVLADKFQVPDLKTLATNVIEDMDEFLNPSLSM